MSLATQQLKNNDLWRASYRWGSVGFTRGNWKHTAIVCTIYDEYLRRLMLRRRWDEAEAA